MQLLTTTKGKINLRRVSLYLCEVTLSSSPSSITGKRVRVGCYPINKRCTCGKERRCNGVGWVVRRLWRLRLPQPCGDHTPVEQQPQVL